MQLSLTYHKIYFYKQLPNFHQLFLNESVLHEMSLKFVSPLGKVFANVLKLFILLRKLKHKSRSSHGEEKTNQLLKEALIWLVFACLR